GAHIAVGLLAAAWLQRGESALAQLLRAVAALAFRPLLIAVASVSAHLDPVRRATRPALRIRTSRTRLFAHSVGRRGPPCSALV
ncbi:hypothetical protein P8605_47830, partial [Streptomyces sp. T-3]|nr:hypothetical protein [Streptomyces sp. T-3]